VNRGAASPRQEQPRDVGTDRSHVPALLPFLKWVGGKQRMVVHLQPHLPTDLDSRIYREPFLGGGSLFLRIKPRKSFLSDANEHLIRCFKYVRENPSLVARYLREHGRHHGKRYYYSVRRAYVSSPFSVAQSARFIYLNKACFNGIFRVNRQGQFNVPYGYRKKVLLPDREQLCVIANRLKRTSLTVASFEASLAKASATDFVYLDPPYPPLNGTSYFTHYTADRFGEIQQRALAKVVKEIDGRGVLFLMTNADVPLIRQLYSRYNIVSLPVTRFVTCKETKHVVQELVITNYEAGSA
jgi:DNA adenine methylase